MEYRPSLHLGVVAIEKGAFGPPSTKGRQLYFLLNVFKYRYVSLTIQLDISHLFTQIWMIKQFNLKQFVVYWPPTPPNMPFQRRRKCIFHWRGRTWLTIWDRVKIPRYSHRLMHRKKVTWEQHDSYFRLMTIKHAIPKTAEVHIPMASYGQILSGRELLYNWVHRKFNRFGDEMR